MYLKFIGIIAFLIFIFGCGSSEKMESAPEAQPNINKPISQEESNKSEYKKASPAAPKKEASNIKTKDKKSNGEIALSKDQDRLAVSEKTDTKFNTENYEKINDNPFLTVKENPLSTFSVDVDTASYANVRRFLNSGSLPPKDAVRIEELVNYFIYEYKEPKDKTPFSVATEISRAPWKQENHLMKIAIKGYTIDEDKMPPRNLVFLLDVSGSMLTSDKLPLVKSGLKLLLNQLTEKDTISIVVYAGASGLALEPTNAKNKSKIISALDALEAGGSTNGGEGIKLAYTQARKNFKQNGINRVILATDGDFNVGISSEGDLIRLIEAERETGVFLTVLGFGTGNIKDSTMEKLANKGNGNYAYIDSLNEAKKVLVTQAGGTLVTIAKDVKLQLEFNPKYVKSYRLIGYENRLLRNEDFNDDKKDAGEIGAGHNVTALYELVPVNSEVELPKVDPLKYQEDRKFSKGSNSDEILTIKIRYKAPDGNKSKLLNFPILNSNLDIGQTSNDFRFAASVTIFGMILRDSEHKGKSDFNMVSNLAKNSLGKDDQGYRKEFLTLVEKAKKISKK